MRSGCEDVDKATMSAKAQKAMGLATAAQELRDVANTFVTLQKRRHWADYSPTGKITRAEVRDLVDLAEFSISQLVAANTEQRRNFLAFLMMSTRE